MSVRVVRDAGGLPAYAVLVIDQRRYRVGWHPGSVVPGGPWPVPDRLAGAELRTVVATFNGGFMNAASRGGVLAFGVRHGALRTGAASLVIDAAGRASILSWGRDRAPARAVVVRQNLDLLIDRGVVAGTVGQDDSPVWGKGIRHRHSTWRTGVGTTRSGELVVVQAARATTRQLAAVLLAQGAVRAMELDINPQFSCVLTYTHPAGRPVGHPVLPQQQGSASRYLQSSTRDFFAVLTR